MQTQHSAVAALLNAVVAEAVQQMPAEQRDKLLKGELRPSISFIKNGAAGKSVRAKKTRVPPVCTMPEAAMRDIRAQLNEAKSREEGHRIVCEALPGKAKLLAFARFYDMGAWSGDRIADIRKRIVEVTVGDRLDFAAIVNYPRVR